MKSINVLDTTLRDGGYINNWEFGTSVIQKIIECLDVAEIDFIECGFMKDLQYNPEQSLYSSIDDIYAILPKNINRTKIVGMITYGEFDVLNLPKKTNSDILGFRVIFKKYQWKEALYSCKFIKEKGWKLFINPTFTDQYSDTELLELISEVNKIKPEYLTIVDSMGVMRKNDLIRFYSLIDHNLDKDIGICFHSHNNLQLSFSNAESLLELHSNRDIIIDTCLFGIGRGAGNLCTELLTQYLNENYNKHYNLMPILEAIDKYIMPIFSKNPWGYSVPYYLAAIHNCHPNYAAYFFNKQTLTLTDISQIINTIQSDKLAIYDKKYAEILYQKYLTHNIDDSMLVEHLHKVIQGKSILVLAPGHSIIDNEGDIQKWITKENPIIISTNFIPKNIQINYLFISNLKRFEGINNIKSILKNGQRAIVSSNIVRDGDDVVLIANYGAYVNSNQLVSDNSVLMLLSLLQRCGGHNVVIAGFDGFGTNRSENYCDDKLLHPVDNSILLAKNKEIKKELDKIGLKLTFLTKSKYNE